MGTIKSSNLCVSPETLILTKHGYLEIQKLQNTEVEVWNGTEFSRVTINKTNENEELIEIHTTDGCVLHCTIYHKFFIKNEAGEVETVDALWLKRNQEIIHCDFPIIDGIDGPEYTPYNTPYDAGADTYNSILPEIFVPVNYSLSTKLRWFSGFYNSNTPKIIQPKLNINHNTTNHSNDNQTYVQIKHPNQSFLFQVKLLLQTCGINTIALDNFLTISVFDLNSLLTAGLTNEQTQAFTPLSQDGFKDAIKISNSPVRIYKVVNKHRISDTYCFNEPKRHAGIFGGIITSQCSEIIEYSDENETAVCNLASIGLPTFIDTTHNPPVFDYNKLFDITKIITYNLNRIIDINFYPTEKTERSNKRHRPIGIGIQGLADVFMMMNLPFTSPEAKRINSRIFETIYFAALTESCNIAKVEGAYDTFAGSPASKGLLQFDLWNFSPSDEFFEWTALKTEIQKHGLRNSLLLAPMPTASTSQILGFNECFEPITSNIYSRRTNAGEFIISNKYLMKDLIKLDMWNEKIKNNIIANNGSVQQIETIPQEIREKYRTVWELPMRQIIDMAADRGVYICQSQSLNLWIEDPNYSTLTSMHFYAWSKGLKTGIYYLRRRGRHQAQQFTIEPTKADTSGKDDICEMCSA